MKSDVERIGFVLRFVEMNLDGLREGDWLNLREDVVTFLGWSSRYREQVTLEGAKLIKEKVSEILTGIAHTFAPNTPGDWQASLPRVLRTSKVQTGEIFRLRERGEKGVTLSLKSIEFLFFDVSEPGRTRVLVSPSLEKDGSLSAIALQNAFSFSLLTTLSRLDITYLRQCRSCSRLFYAAHGRQMFCTPQCASREGTKRFRNKHEKEETERGRVNYEKKVKKKLGPNVRIGKRKNQPDEEVK